MPDFMSDLAVRLVECAYLEHGDNHDSLRFRDEAAAMAEGVQPDRQGSIEMMGWVRDLAGPLQHTYGIVADEHSRRTLVDVIAYRILGPRRVKLGRNDAEYERAVAALPSLAKQQKTVAVAMLDGWLNRYDLRPIGFPITADLHPLNVLYTYQLQQYRYDREGTVVEPAAGDVAIDGGGCWGDTALYLAHKVGPNGRVHCFEFSPDNLPTLEANWALNPALRPTIQLERNALWSNSGTELSFNPAGPGTRVGGDGGGGYKVRTLSIDDLAERERLPHVDFIKMDIEGAELDALRGSERTIRKFKPKLAVTLYHRLQDFATIPKFLDDLGLGYRFFIDHFSINREETVLFAMWREEGRRQAED
jgi:FkbM family methyltransferase